MEEWDPLVRIEKKIDRLTTMVTVLLVLILLPSGIVLTVALWPSSMVGVVGLLVYLAVRWLREFPSSIWITGLLCWWDQAVAMLTGRRGRRDLSLWQGEEP